MTVPVLVNTGLFLLFGMALLYTPSTALVGLSLASFGVYCFISKPPLIFLGQFPDERHVLVALFCMGLVLLTLNIHHQESWGVYHLANATLLSLPIFFALAHTRVSLLFLWSGGAFGAMIALIIALYEVFFLNSARAGSLVHNPIPFGSVSMCLAAASVIGYQAKNKAWCLTNAWALAGMFAGVGAAVLSGSKGCLLALPVLTYVFYIKCIHPMALRRTSLLVGTLVALVVLAWLASDSFLFSRIEEAVHGALTWVETGRVVEGSVGPRLELIRFAFDAGMVNPLTGIGHNGMLNALTSSTTTGAFDPFIGQLHTVHNEFLNIWVTKGLLGLFAMGAMYGLSLWYFWRLRRHPDAHVQNIGLMGVSLCLMYLLFGLSEVALQLTFFRNFFLVTLVSLLGMAHAHQHRAGQSA